MVRDGFAAAMIRSVVEDGGIDLVVVGTHGAHGVEKAFLGSVAEDVFRSVTCPVMTVGPNVQENYGGKFDSILFATDLSPQSLRAAQYAISWALETHAHLTMLHVISDHLNDRLTDDVLEWQRKALIELRSWIPEDATFWCEPRAEVALGDPETEILAAAERYKSNLVVMSVRKAGMLASHAPWALASRIVQKAKCPVLTVRDHYGD
jgi:nucleotide-binding universal stress UspA family protein